jgi:hypothetical protein
VGRRYGIEIEPEVGALDALPHEHYRRGGRRNLTPGLGDRRASGRHVRAAAGPAVMRVPDFDAHSTEALP